MRDNTGRALVQFQNDVHALVLKRSITTGGNPCATSAPGFIIRDSGGNLKLTGLDRPLP